MICVLVMTDGRRACIEQALPSLRSKLIGPIAEFVIHDDSGDSEYQAWLRERWSTSVIATPSRQGFGGAIQNAWRHVARLPVSYVFHTEDDFLLTRTVDLRSMVDVLAAHPYLVQLALLRQAVNAAERKAGGVIPQHPESYKTVQWKGLAWREHNRHFTTNPSLIRRSLIERGWPDGPQSEGHFGLRLFAKDPKARAAYWGAEGEWCEHIGYERVGNGY